MTINVTKKILDILLYIIVVFSALLIIFLYFGVYLKITESGFLYLLIFSVLIFFDIFFYILPLTLISFFVLIYFFLCKIYNKTFKDYWNKTKYIFFILLVSVILGIISCFSTDATGTFFKIYEFNPY